MNIAELIEKIKWIPTISVTFIDIAQMTIIAFVLWYLAKTLYKTRAWILVKGLFVIGIIYLIICLTDMVVLQIIMQSLFGTLIIAIVIMLQPELQKIVELIGTRKLTDIKPLLFKKYDAATWYSEKTIYEITAACEIMSDAKTGALIAIERGIPLTDYTNSGIRLNSDVSNQLLINIFEKNTPLHDGAVIISNDHVESATCYLPLSMDYTIDKTLGTRHRAAIGISEITDCIVVVVSEETGAISICVDGNIKHDINRQELADTLRKLMQKSEEKIREIRRSHSPMWIKICAPIMSVIIWMAVISSNDPIVTKVIDDVPVVTINTEVLDVAGHTYVIKDGDTISVRVEGPRSLVDNMTKDDLYATADFSQLSVVFSVPIDVEPTEAYADVDVVSFKKHTMTLAIEEMVHTEIQIEVEFVGDDNVNYVVMIGSVEIDALGITCPQSIAKTLDKAIVTIDVYGKTNHFISTNTPVLYDKNGDVVPDGKYTLDQDTIRVQTNVYQVKEVPIKIDITEQDVTADSYYVLKNYTTEVTTVRVAAIDNVGSTITDLNIILRPEHYGPGSNRVLVNLQAYLPDGVYLAKNQEGQITVDLELAQYQKKTLALPWDDIQLTGYDASSANVTILEAPTSISLYYDVEMFESDMITIEMLQPVIRVSAKEDGTCTGILSIMDIDGVEIITELGVKYSLKTNKKGD